MPAMFRKAVLLVLVSLLSSSVAVAQLNRSAVSVTGNDAASCSVPDPCRTFGVALSKTNPNGEVVALTSGGYGPFTIDKSATIVAAPGVYAALVATAGDAVQVTAAATDRVVVRGLHLYGMGTGLKGIFGNTGAQVHVENCVIDGFDHYGIAAGPLKLFVSDTTIRRCRLGGIFAFAVEVAINRVEVTDSGLGVQSQSAIVTVRDSVAADCGVGFDVFNGRLTIENSLATNNSGAGVRASSSGTARVSNTMATDNGVGFENLASTFISWGNNRVRGNGTDKSGTITVVTPD